MHVIEFHTVPSYSVYLLLPLSSLPPLCPSLPPLGPSLPLSSPAPALLFYLLPIFFHFPSPLPNFFALHSSLSSLHLPPLFSLLPLPFRFRSCGHPLHLQVSLGSRIHRGPDSAEMCSSHPSQEPLSQGYPRTQTKCTLCQDLQAWDTQPRFV